jgi:hypothetical protein
MKTSVRVDEVAGGCVVCGAQRLHRIGYLSARSHDFVRNLAYAMPGWLASSLAHVSARFAAHYHSVAVNKRYFDGHLLYCVSCSTGWCSPLFDESTLSRYYQEFYWSNRDKRDGQHVSETGRPNEQQLSTSRDRWSWVRRHVPEFTSLIDFGAGDCAASFLASADHGVSHVHVVDPSAQTRALAEGYGFFPHERLDGVPLVDMLYSAHSIEHVAKLIDTLRQMLQHVRVGGHVFIETPNIADQSLFEGLVHTPHTYLLSEGTFRALETVLPMKIVAIEACGPMWQQPNGAVISSHRADLRVLMQRC